jgi:hypothetical protein
LASAASIGFERAALPLWHSASLYPASVMACLRVLLFATAFANLRNWLGDFVLTDTTETADFWQPDLISMLLRSTRLFTAEVNCE